MKISFQTDNKQNSDSQLQNLVDEAKIASWLGDVRSNAFDKYSNSTLPTRKTEHWKYNDMYFLSQSEYQFEISAPQIVKKTISPIKHQGTEINIVNGQLIEDSDSDLDIEIRITPFNQATESQQKLILENFRSTQQDRNLLINLNTALTNNGVLIEIAANANIEQPIYINHESVADNTACLRTNQTIVHCEKNSHCQIVERFGDDLASPTANNSGLILQQTIISLAQNSRCHHHRLNLESPTVSQLSRSVTRLASNAFYKGFFFSSGSFLNKTDIDILHQGEHSASELAGIYLPSGENCIDYHTNIEHQVANCTSREVFRGIIADSAKATFNGKIHIFKNAQKTDAQLNNKNLLLTNTAEVNTKPELEIYADDVVCAHGATVAKIDEQAIYYMQTRGINPKTARRMLSHGFINELLDKIDNDAIKTSISSIVLDALTTNS